MVLICIQEVPDADYPDRGFCGFHRPCKGKFRDVPYVRLRPHPSTFFPIETHYIPIIRRHRASTLRKLCTIRPLVSVAAEINATTTVTGCNYYNFRVKGLQLFAVRCMNSIPLLKWCEPALRVLFLSDRKAVTDPTQMFRESASFSSPFPSYCWHVTNKPN